MFEKAVLEKRYGLAAAEALCEEIAKADAQNIVHFKAPSARASTSQTKDTETRQAA